MYNCFDEDLSDSDADSDSDGITNRNEIDIGTKEALNKSRHTSYLHIFRLIARKLLEIHQSIPASFSCNPGGGVRLTKNLSAQSAYPI